MCEEELGPVHHVHGEQFARLDAILMQILPIPAGVGVGFSPGVAAIARPDGFFLCGETTDLGFELVPETLASSLRCSR